MYVFSLQRSLCKTFTKTSVVKVKLIQFSIAHSCLLQRLSYSLNSPCLFTKNALNSENSPCLLTMNISMRACLFTFHIYWSVAALNSCGGKVSKECRPSWLGNRENFRFFSNFCVFFWEIFEFVQDFSL